MTEDARSFRTVLNQWLLLLVALVFLPLLVMVVREPWQALDGLIGQANVVLSGADQSIQADDLRMLDLLAVDVVWRGPTMEEEPESASGFVLLVTQGSCLSADQIQRTLSKEKATLQADQIFAACERWREWMNKRPENTSEQAAFLRVHHALGLVHAASLGAELVADDVYLTVDTGITETGFFRDHIAFVAGALPWWSDAVYPGQGYDVTGGEFWRYSYLPEYGGKTSAFSHNPIHDPVLPRFEVDQWGTWFSVWYTRLGAPDHYNSLTIDIDASSVRGIMWEALLKVVAGLVILALLAWMAARRLSDWVSQPVRELRRGAEAVMGLDYNYAVPTVGQGEFVALIKTFNQMVRGLGERANLLKSLEKLLSKELARQAAEKGIELGGEQVDATVLFTDFAGFSTLTRNLDAALVVSTLNEYFGLLIPIIKRWGGFPDKYIGDAIVALFGTPVHYENHAERAVRCAIELQQQLREFNAQRRAAGKLVFEMRIGLNTGTMMVGAIGCDDKLEFTSIGEPTNLANRMESICPIGHVMVAEGTWAQIKEVDLPGVRVQGPEARNVKGYPEPVRAVALYLDVVAVGANGSERSPEPKAEPYRYSRA